MPFELLQQIVRVGPEVPGLGQDLPCELAHQTSPAQCRRLRLRPLHAEDVPVPATRLLPDLFLWQGLVAKRVLLPDRREFGRRVEDRARAHPHPVVHLREGRDDQVREEGLQAHGLGPVDPFGELGDAEVAGPAVRTRHQREVLGPPVRQPEVRLFLLPEAERYGDPLHQLPFLARVLDLPVGCLSGIPDESEHGPRLAGLDRGVVAPRIEVRVGGELVGEQLRDDVPGAVLHRLPDGDPELGHLGQGFEVIVERDVDVGGLLVGQPVRLLERRLHRLRERLRCPSSRALARARLSALRCCAYCVSKRRSSARA